jgi:hypothetical protein
MEAVPSRTPPLGKEPHTDAVATTPVSSSSSDHTEDAVSSSPLPGWLRWILPPDEAAAKADACTADHPPSFVWTLSWRTGQGLVESVIDPTLLPPNSHTLTDLIDKVLTSTPRLLAMANFLLSLTYLLHTAVADAFLGRHVWAPRDRDRRAAAHGEKLGGFLVFKLLLISAVVAPDTLDLLILLSWYTLLSFWRSLAHLSAAAIAHGTAVGQAPPAGVMQLLTVVWMGNILAAAVCVALFHGAGWGMVWLLTTDCALLALDVMGHTLQYTAALWEVSQAAALSVLEEADENNHHHNNNNHHDAGTRAVRHDDYDEDGLADRDDDNATEWYEVDGRAVSEEDEAATAAQPASDEPSPNQRKIQRLEEHHARRMNVLDTTIFLTQICSHTLTIAHFLHIWSLHGVQWTLIDGVLGLHLHSAISSASRQIAQRRNLHRIARHLDDVFEDATVLELRKHTQDVCCVCLCGLSSHVKKVACGHLYHSHCLREVVERARSMETAKCPLCRACVLDGERQAFAAALVTGDAVVPRRVPDEGENRNANATEVAGEAHVPEPQLIPPPPPQPEQQQQQALFRFSTDAILPAWIPIPNFSFEIVRRPPTPQPETSWFRRLLLWSGAVPMTPAEEAVAAEQLVDMFPQYDRADLVRELRTRGSTEGVAEAILTGVFTGVPR